MSKFDTTTNFNTLNELVETLETIQDGIELATAIGRTLFLGYCHHIDQYKSSICNNQPTLSDIWMEKP